MDLEFAQEMETKLNYHIEDKISYYRIIEMYKCSIFGPATNSQPQPQHQPQQQQHQQHQQQQQPPQLKETEVK
jgi:hypothetical protein